MTSGDTWTDKLEQVTHCILCGCAKSSLWLQSACPERPERIFTIVECDQCALRFVSPRPTGQALSEYYAVDYYSYVYSDRRPRSHRLKQRLYHALGVLPPAERPGWRWRVLSALTTAALGARAAWLLPAPTAGRRFLDIGCGVGQRLELARDLGWETYGLDLGEEAVAIAAGHGHHTFVSDALHLPVATASVDYLNMSHVLEHTPDPLRALQEGARVLKPGGIGQIAVPNSASWAARRYGTRWRSLDLPRHLYHFTPRTAAALAERAGLRVRLLRTLPARWEWLESRKAAGQPPPGRLERWLWKIQPKLAQGDSLDLWLVKE